MSGAANLQIYRDVVGSCTRCRETDLIHREVDGRWAHPLFHQESTGASGVVVILEAPNWADTFDPDKGRMTIDVDVSDPTGIFARQLFESVGLRIEDLIFTNAVLCLPKWNGRQYPVTGQLQRACGWTLERLLADVSPRAVVTLGGTALQALAAIEPHGLKLRSAAGQVQTWKGYQLLPLYHPSLLGRVSRRAEQQLEDIQALRELLR